VGEALAVLAGCMAAILFVGALLVLVLAPRLHTATFDLVPVEGEKASAPADLVARVRALELTDDVEIAGPATAPRLVLAGLASTDNVGDLVHRVLREAGYELLPFRVRSWPEPDPQAVMVYHPRILLGAQSVVLLAFGGLFGALRVRRAAVGVPAALPRAVLVGIGVGVLGFLASATIGLLQAVLGFPIEEQAWLVDLLRDDGAALGLAPWVVVLAPFAEEVFFRGYLFRFLNERIGPRVAYPMSAACFSLIHFHLPGLVVYFVVGLLFAWACQRTSTLAAAVVAHVVYNGAALGVALLTLGG